MKILIKTSEGIKYSKLSKDYNKIHINEKYASNSLFGEMICHGCHVISILISKNKKLKRFFKKNKFNFKADFYEGIFYNNYLSLNISGNKFNIIQDKIKKLTLTTKISNNNKLVISKNKINLRLEKNQKNTTLILSNLLNKISYYVGMIYPGENSIIKSISVDFNNKKIFNKGNSVIIFSQKKKPRYPFINNTLLYKNFLINFETLFRPKFTFKKNMPNKKIIYDVKSITNNVLIIGASNGIGREILDIFQHNKNIKIFATYKNNKILNTHKNVNVFKYDIQFSSKKLINLIKKKSIKYIYYMATPKINLNKNSNLKKYHNFYFDFPITLLKKIKNKKICFYYPSTVFVNQKINEYTSTKLKFEKYIKKNFSKNLTINCPKLPEINTRQNINFFNRKFPSFIRLLNTNKQMRNDLFFN